MKYTLEDFENKKIAVWVESEEEYGKFCDFARNMEWYTGIAVREFTPEFPCEIIVVLRYGEHKMAYDDRKGYLSQFYPSSYQPVTVDELDLEPEVKNEESAAAKEIAENLVNYVIEASKKRELTSVHQIALLEAVRWVLQK